MLLLLQHVNFSTVLIFQHLVVKIGLKLSPILYIL
jgi:hypothetical protein